jgi:hypothetical protein
MELTGGPHLAVTEGEGVISELRNVKKETYFGQYATAAQAGMGRAVGPSWAGEVGGLGRSAGQGRGRGKPAGPRRVAGPQGRPGRKQGKEFLN